MFTKNKGPTDIKADCEEFRCRKVLGCYGSQGSSKRDLLYWDNRVLELIDMQVGAFSIS